jgi:hypothetical protein
MFSLTKGRPGGRDSFVSHRIRFTLCACERSIPRGRQDPHPRPGILGGDRCRPPPWPGSAKSAMSPTRSCTWNGPHLSRARSCMSTGDTTPCWRLATACHSTTPF